VAAARVGPRSCPLNARRGGYPTCWVAAVAFAEQQLAKAIFCAGGGYMRMNSTDIGVYMTKVSGGSMTLKGKFFSGCLSIAFDRSCYVSRPL